VIRSHLFVTTVLAVGLTAPLWTQDKKEAKPAASYPVVLTPGAPDPKLAPRYSPPGRQLKLEPKEHKDLAGFDHLETRVKLGPNAKTDAGHLLVLARSEKGKPYDRLYVDADGTGKLAEKPIAITPKVVRKNLWSSFDAMLRVNHGKPGAAAAYEEFPVSFWAVVEKEADRPDVLRISRRGFLAGEVRLGDTTYDVVLSDSGTDGVLGAGDWWEIRAKAPQKGIGMRTVGDFAWAGGKAWKLEVEGTNGRKAKVVAFDPGLTEEEDVAKRDRMREDRLAARAAKPVAFRKDVDAALKDAAKNKSAYFLKFETDWCMPCKDMTALVFTAKDVADAATGVTCIVVDGDERKDLTGKHAVKGYPTGILFDADGKEIARYSGYKGVKETTAFLQKAKR
jgi:hypothetical protein